MSDPREDARATEAPLLDEHDEEGLDDLPEDSLDEVELKDLLRGALRPPEGSVAPSLLPAVQRKLRLRSRGKFYGDGWSTARAPRSTYMITSLVMLGLMLFILLVLVPWSSGSLP